MTAMQITDAAPRAKALASSLLVAALIQIPLPSAYASLLGEAVRVSAVGEPLLVELHSPGNTPERAAECVRVFSTPARSPGLEVITNAQLSVSGSGQNARLLVRRSTPAFEPIIQLTLLNICDPRLQRKYTLFLDPPIARPGGSRSPAPLAPATMPAATTDSGAVWSTVRGESLGSIARALYPKDRATRQRFIDEVMRANPESFAGPASVDAALPRGTELRIPDLSRSPASAPAPRSAGEGKPKSADRPRPSPPAPNKAKTPAAQPSSPDPTQAPGRLVLEGDQATKLTQPGEIPPPIPAGDGPPDNAALVEREAMLVAAIDQTIKTQLELMDRLRRLEEVHAALKAQLETAPPESAQQPTTPQGVAAPVATADAIPSRDLPAAGNEGGSEGGTNTLLAALAGLALLTALLLVAIKRRRNAGHAAAAAESTMPDASIWPDEAPTTVGERTTFSETQVPQRAGKAVAPLDFDMSAETSSPEAETLPPVTMTDEPVEEHDSAVELADIMISFGRVHGAAETLADFIRSNPRQAVTPWLKLMDVYRLAGMRMEFDALARQLNKTFNVKAVTWDNFDEARKPVHSIEQMPHLIDILTKTWGTRECQAFLEKLLRDNRDGLREGFPISIIDEILTLTGVLEEEIGRYRPALAA